jgi:prevent-host-death family protein
MAGYRIVSKTVLRDRLRRELGDLFDQDIVVTSRSRPVAVIVSLSNWNALQDKIDRLEEAIALEDLGLPVPLLPGRWRTEAGSIDRR